VPGRHEIGAAQELNYPPLMKTLLEIGYTGFVGHEFLPTRDPVQSLSEAVRICAV
jgi:hydroxypyruvate isomerase